MKLIYPPFPAPAEDRAASHNSDPAANKVEPGAFRPNRDHALRKVITKEVQEQLQEAFAYATGFGVVFIDPDGAHIGPGSNFSEFCQKVNCTERGRELCYESNRCGVNFAIESGETTIYICHANLVSISVPIIVEGEYLGAMTAGQVKTENPALYADKSAPSRVDWLQDPEMAVLYELLPFMTSKQIEASAVAMEKIAQFVMESYQKLQLEKDLRRMESDLRLAEEELNRTRYYALVSQVRPHFLFNVLNTISHLLVLGEIDKAQFVLKDFAQLLRYQLRQNHDLVSLEEEVNYIISYLQIQGVRFEDKLTYDLDLDPACKDYQIPFFSLQTLVDNAMEHGILAHSQNGRIELVCRQESDGLFISISDTGQGMSQEKLAQLESLINTGHGSNQHVGLRNSYLRFKSIYKDRFSMCICSKENCGTRIELRVKDEADNISSGLTIRHIDPRQVEL
jgi:two-component system LytT family sensor kinase